MNTHSPSPSLDHVSLPRSAIMETKDKFDSFLKAALKEPTSKNISINKTLKKSSLTSHHTLEEENVIKGSVCENRDFILNKFFEGSFETPKRNAETKPIPKPRTKILAKSRKSNTFSLPESYETFKVKTTKLIPVKPENNEVFPLGYEESKSIDDSISQVSSGETFRVDHPKILKTPQKNLSNEKKYKAENEKSIIAHYKTKVQLGNSSKDVDHDIGVLEGKIENKGDSISEMKSETSKVNIPKEDQDDEVFDIHSEKFIEEKPFQDVIHLIIHKTDKLLLNSLVIHPVVKIHIVDINTGNYYPKKHKERSVMYYYDNYLHYIPPIMTHPFNLQEQRSLIPMWEETILINEEFDYLVTEKENLIIFFEILDFMSLPALNEQTKGWHKIAFAFLKVGTSHSMNLGKAMRLQLYYSSSKKDDPQRCTAWDKWHKKKLTKYPSTLYITLDKIKSGGKQLTGLRSKDAMQEEIGTVNFKIKHSDNLNNTQKMNISPLVHIIEKKIEGRNVDQITKLPNKCLAQFPTEEGCFTLKFSHNGLFLACGLKVDKIYTIVIFSVLSFEEICHFPGHQGIIYSINWSPDDSLLTAASADGSVSVWDVLKMSFLQILPHSYFVYTSDVNQKFIVTGCYDAVVRLWKNESVVADFVLNQELKGHNGYITCVLFKNNHKSLLSSDSMGLILEWNMNLNSWGLCRSICISDLKGTIINQIELIGNEKRLLIHSRDSILRILDLKTLIIVNWLHGGLNRRFHTSCSISPCGHFIIAGSENSLINIWNVKNGKYVGNLIPFSHKSLITIHTLSFHPKNNILAVGHYGSRLPVLVFGYDEQNNTSRIQSKLFESYKIKAEINAENLEQRNNTNKMEFNKFEKELVEKIE